MSEPSWVGLAVALGVGLLVGVERERRKGRGPQRRAAGLRTFALVTVAGALAQSLAPGALVVVGALAVTSFAALAYWRAARRSAEASDDPGLTTEIALVVAYLVGVQCAVQPTVGAAAGAVLAGLLAAREHMHRFATEWLTEQELRDALVLAGVALVVVPLVPAAPLRGLGGLGEGATATTVVLAFFFGGLAPRTAALLVLLILGIQAAAHVARRLLGERHALVAAGLLGGFVSSTATIATLGAQARTQTPAGQRRLAGAAALSAAATWVQALVLAAATSAALLPWLAPTALAGSAAAALAGGMWLRHASNAAKQPAGDARERRPLRLREALIVAALLLGVSMAVAALRRHFGTEGLLAGTAVAALADAHAPMAAAFGLHAQGALGAHEALAALLVASAVNSASRSVVAFASGGRGYGARVAAALAASWVAALLGLLAATTLGA
jgi:uncharacterized membrane protein (DUF4010 family)